MISVVVPTYNEKESISLFLRTLNKCLKGLDFEVVIIDDSTDKTVSVAKNDCRLLRLKHRIIHRKNEKGKGSAVAKGLSIAKGDIIAVIDADLEYHPRFIPLMIKKLQSCDLVTASRIRSDVWYRRVLGYVFKLFVLILFNISFETQSGLKVMKHEALKDIELKSKGWVWDVELIKKFLDKKYTVCTQIIPYTTRELGKSKIKLLTPLYMLKDLVLLRLSL